MSKRASEQTRISHVDVRDVAAVAVRCAFALARRVAELATATPIAVVTDA